LSSLEAKLNEALELDLASSASLTIFQDELKLGEEILFFLDGCLKRRERLLDLGIGYGFMTRLMKEYLGFTEAYGIDIDDQRLSVGRSRGVNVYHLDLEIEPFPFPTKYFDLVIAMGLLHHLKFFDNVLGEAKRVLRPKGVLLVSDTNLGWWINRLCLLLGSQPPDIEVSRTHAVGLPGFYPRRGPIGYVHSVTLRGMEELLSLYGFEVTKVFGARIPRRFLEVRVPGTCLRNRVLKTLIKTADHLLSERPSLSVRFFIISQSRVS